MTNYIGYGFDVNDIEAKDWIELVKKHDEKTYKEICEECSDASGSPNPDRLEKAVLDYIEEDSAAEYLKSVINAQEMANTGITDSFVQAYDHFVVFDSIDFPDHCPRAEYIRNIEDFIKMISEYVPTDNIKFGNLYDGIDWADPCYFIE